MPKPKPKKPPQIRTPNRFIYFLACKLLAVFFRLFCPIQVQGLEKLPRQGPYVVLCNHICNIDFLIAGVTMYPRRMHYVTGALYFRMAAIRWLLKLMGCISKEQFVPDAPAVRNVIRAIRAGGIVIIFPAGQSSFTGESTVIDPSIAKLLKLLEVPVVSLRIDGAHMVFPKWNMSRLRRGQVQVTAETLCSAQQVAALSEAALYEKVVRSLYFDDYEWQRQARIAAKRPRCVEGLETLLIRCPVCGEEFTLTAEGNALTCGHCGSVARMDVYGLLAAADPARPLPDTPTAWYRGQLDYYAPLLFAGYSYSAPAQLLRILPSGKLQPVAAVTVTIDAAALRLTGTDVSGAPLDWAIDQDLFPVFPHEPHGAFDVPHAGGLYRVKTLDPRAADKFNVLKEALDRRRYAPARAAGQ